MTNNEQQNSLINQLADRLGAKSDDVKDALEKGNLSKVLSNLDSHQAEKISAILSDEEQSRKILSTPQAQALIRKLMG